MTVHSIHCCLGTIPVTFPPSQQSVFNWLSARTSERPEFWNKKATKVVHLAVASVNMISRGRDLFWSRRWRRGTFTSPVSSPNSDYGPIESDSRGTRRCLSRYSLHGSNTLQLRTTFFINRSCITCTIEKKFSMV